MPRTKSETETKLISINAALAERAERLRPLEALESGRALYVHSMTRDADAACSRSLEMIRKWKVKVGKASRAEAIRNASSALRRWESMLEHDNAALERTIDTAEARFDEATGAKSFKAEASALKAQIRDLETEKHGLLQELPL